MRSLFFYFTATIICFASSLSAIATPNPPYVSEKAFRRYADFIYDKTSKDLNPFLVQDGDVIFVEADVLDSFFSDMHPLIRAKYILITCGSKQPAPGNFASYLNDDKLIAWFGQNTDRVDPKLHPIPLGTSHSEETIEHIKSKSFYKQKENLLYFYFSANHSSLEEKILLSAFSKKAYCTISFPKIYPKYLFDLSRFEFTLSSQPKGLDSSCIWESILMGSIPIVQSSPLNSLYEGLPVCIVQNLAEITEEYLKAEKAKIHSQGYSFGSVTLFL